MKRLFLFFLLLLMLSTSFVLADESAILNAESAILQLSLSSELHISPSGLNPTISDLEVRSYLYPVDSYYQQVFDFRTEPRDYDLDEGAVVLSWRRPGMGTLPYSISAKVETDGRHIQVKRKVDFPINPSVLDSEVRRYLDPTEHIDSDNNFIIELAEFLAGESDDLYEVVYNIGVWVSKNIDYNLSTLSEEVSKTSSWVLENRRGVCAEMTSLFIALLRANGVPARYVSGVAYTNSPLFDFNWGAHAWAEAYFPGHGWIPFDVTYGEYGFLSPSHIELRKTADSAEASSYYGWFGRDVDVRADMFDIQTEIVSMVPKQSQDIEVVLAPHSNIVSFGSYNAIEAVVKNLRNYYLPVVLQLSNVNNVEVHSDNLQLLLLKPGESRKVMWTVSVSQNLASGYVYTFPFSVFMQQQELASTQFTSRANAESFSKNEIDRLMQVKELEFERGYSNNVRFVCDFTKRFFYHDEEQELICEITNMGDFKLENLELCLDEAIGKECMTISLDRIQRKEVSITPSNTKIGSRNILITLENELVFKEDSVMHLVLDYPRVYIKDVLFPKEISYGEEYQLRFYVEGTNIPKDLKINVVVNQLSRTWRIDQLSADREFIISLDSRNLFPGENPIAIKVLYDDDNAKTYSVEENYTIELINIPFWRKLYLYPKMWLEIMINQTR